MGFLTTGNTLEWEKAKQLAEYVREHGITQLLAIYHKLKDRKGDILLWGDEIEYMVIRFDEDNQKAQVSLRAHELLEVLGEEEKTTKDAKTLKTLWRPEYANYMLEATPGQPYGGKLEDFLAVEPNMTLRRQIALKLMQPGETIMSLTCFPRLGCPAFTHPEHTPTPEDGEVSKSLFLPDQLIFPHHRFATLTRNIRERRQCKVAMNVPIFRDINTQPQFVEQINYSGTGEGAQAAKVDHIYMDAMGFGMGCSCLQVTFQATSISEARQLYDQLAVVAPIVLALSASAPMFRGYLADVDCRWDVIAGSVDDRNHQERGQEPLTSAKFKVNKSRYDSIDCFISTDSTFKEKYNDLDLVYDADICKRLEENGMDNRLSRHFAHLFIRDPLVIYANKVKLNDQEASDHFENIQSTNWQTVRFKPPPPKSPIGWRVEFRPTEVQLTDFENAAYTLFVVLLTRVILSFNLNLYIPISKVDENMHAAQQRDAIKKEVFHFRKHISGTECIPAQSPLVGSIPTLGDGHDPDEFTYMSINQIINGEPGSFPGLIPMIEVYLDSINIDIETRSTLERYLLLIKRRASGELLTAASWMREFVNAHPDYKNDSKISDKINFDLMKVIDALGKGETAAPTLLGDLFPAKAD
eukprot:m.208962 g.208962  ORF g.208962 m.208962 type:complete len:639 (-) comp26094_c2_seq4:71-1987(-)